MASIKENNLELNYGWPYGESGWNSGMDENIVKLGFESRKRINGILSSPPSSPSNGDAYLVGTTPTGLFSGKFANIAIYDRSSWIFIVPKNQEVVFNTSDGCDYIYNDGWSLKLEEEVTPYIKVKDFNFSTGYTITDQRQCLLNIADNHYYQWNGTLPKVVSAGSTPATSGGVGAGAWSAKTDLMLRSDINIVQRRFSSVAEMLADGTIETGMYLSTGATTWVYNGGGTTDITNYTPISKPNGRDWNVVAGYPTIDTTPTLVQAISDCKAIGCELFLPDINDGYLISGNGTINFNQLGCDIKGKLRFGADTTGYIVIGGNSAALYNKKQHIEFVDADVARDINAPCIVIKGSKSQDITVNYTPSLWLYAQNADSAQNYSIGYNRFNFGYVKNIWLKGDGAGTSSLGGWVNENTFYISRCTYVVIGTEDADGYKHNNNRFYGGAFEGNEPHILVNNGRDNTFYDVRLEGAAAGNIVFGDESINTKIFLSWASSQTSEPAYQARYTDAGRGNIIGSNGDALYATYEICNLSAETVKLDNDSYPKDCAIYEVGGWNGVTADATRTNRDIAIKKIGNKLAINVNNAICYKSGFIPVSPTGDTRLLVSTAGWEEVGGKGYRFELYGYDSNMNQLTASTEDMYVNGRGLVGFGAVTTAGRRVGDVVNIINPTCSYVRMVLRVTGVIGDQFSFIRAALRTPKVAVNTDGTVRQASHFMFNGMNPSLPKSRLSTSISITNNVAASINFAVPDMSGFTLTAIVSTTSANGYQYHSINSVGDGTLDWVETVITNVAGDGGNLDLTLTSVDTTNKVAYFTLSKPAGAATTTAKLSLLVDCPDGVWLA